LIDISEKILFFFSVCHDTLLFKYAEKMCNNIMKREQRDIDPPIPPGRNICFEYKRNLNTKENTKIILINYLNLDLLLHIYER